MVAALASPNVTQTVSTIHWISIGMVSLRYAIISMAKHNFRISYAGFQQQEAKEYQLAYSRLRKNL